MFTTTSNRFSASSASNIEPDPACDIIRSADSMSEWREGLKGYEVMVRGDGEEGAVTGLLPCWIVTEVKP